MPLSDHVDLLVVGAGPAALSAARGFRATRPGGDIGLVTDEGVLPYRRPPLTKELLRREMRETDLTLEDDHWFADHGVRLIAGRAVRLDPEGHRVVLAGGRVLTYRRCVLAPGAEPVRPSLPGVDDPAVRVLRTRSDLHEIELRLRDAERIVVVGSGFVGCEIAGSLRTRGFGVTLVSEELAPQAARLGRAVASRLAGWLRTSGVDLRLGAPVRRIERCDERLRVHTGGGHAPGADVVVLAAGAQPRLELAEAAGLPCPDGGIPADEHMATPLPDVFVAGDAALARHALLGRPLRVEHWGDALAQGEIAGRAAAGDEDARWEAVPGFWSTIGGRTVKCAWWGDGHDDIEIDDHGDGAFTAWYRDARGRLVGVLTHGHDDDYDDARRRMADETAVAA
jgi:3-phenylpropionate/trans-cinnamate dioxygenase ferredoxin reductase subunit